MSDEYEFDDCFQTCEALQGCESEAWSLCRKCCRWLCGRHAGSHAHGCEVSVDEQYEQRRGVLAKLNA
jgi:hypothetical protein